MAIAFDATTHQTHGNTSSFTHTPVGTPRLIVVQSAQAGSSTDQITGVTYGGVTMARVNFAQDTAGEPGAAYMYFLGASIPTGAQTVTVTIGSGGNNKSTTATSYTANHDTELAGDGSGLVEGDAANPSITVANIGAARPAYGSGVVFSGQSAVSSITAGTGYTDLAEHDFGVRTASHIRADAETSGGDVTVDWTIAIDDVAAIGGAFREMLVEGSVGAGNVVLTGFAPATGLVAPAAAVLEPVGAGAIALTGFAPGVSITGLSKGIPTAGTLSLAGAAPGVAVVNPSIVVAGAAKTPAGHGRPTEQPRTIILNGQRIRVRSYTEERLLLTRHLEKLHRQKATKEAQKPSPPRKRRTLKLSGDIQRTEDLLNRLQERQEWTKQKRNRQRAEEELVIALLS